MLNLRAGSRDMLLTAGLFFFSARAGRDPTRASVIAHVVHSDVIHDHRLGVDVGHVGDIVHRPVVEEGSVIPISALVPDSGVTEAVVDAAIEPDLGAPVTLIKSKLAPAPTPVTRGPQET